MKSTIPLPNVEQRQESEIIEHIIGLDAVKLCIGMCMGIVGTRLDEG